jgi:hypothetical protein
MHGRDSLPYDSIVLRTADFFLNTPYVASTLEKEPEGLVVNLKELDCTTFVENVFALSRTFAAGDTTFAAYCNNLKRARYRTDCITNYTDRLHYTSDWLYENDRRKIIRYAELSRDSLYIPMRFNLNFMSTHPTAYKQLKTDSTLIPLIKAQEDSINGRDSFYYYIPKDAIDSMAAYIPDGMMVCFMTSVKGLDISHVGVTTRKDSILTFIHASSKAMKVIINPESLVQYVNASKSCTGIMLAQPLPPKREDDAEPTDTNALE